MRVGGVGVMLGDGGWVFALECADSVKSAGRIQLTYINMHDKSKSLVRNIKSSWQGRGVAWREGWVELTI